MGIDAVCINRVFRKIGSAATVLVGIVIVYIVWIELFVQRFNDSPVGKVTTGLRYLFLNNLEFSGRAIFYTTNVVVALVMLGIFFALSLIIRRFQS